MDHFDKKTRVDLTIRGYFVYGMAGYYRISDKPTSKTDKDGVHYLEIPEYMVIRSLRAAPAYDHNTLLKVTPQHPRSKVDGTGPLLFLFDAEDGYYPYHQINGTKALSLKGIQEIYGPDTKIEPVYVEGLFD